MGFENTTVRWTKVEIDILNKNSNKTMEELIDLLPGRSKDSIKSKLKRLHKAKEAAVPAKLIPAMFRYYLDGEAEGQILQRMMKAGYNYTLRDIGIALKKAREESEAIYAEEHKRKPTLDQLKVFIEERIKNG